MSKTTLSAPSVVNVFRSVDEFVAIAQNYMQRNDVDAETKAKVNQALAQAHTAIRLLRIERQGGKT